MVDALRNANCGVHVLSRDKLFTSSVKDTSSFWGDASEDTVVGTPARTAMIGSIVCSARFQTSSWARWVSRVVATAAELHARRPFDLVYSRSLPSIGHVAGYWCARVMGLPWIANINDPWDMHWFPGQSVATKWYYRLSSDFWFRRTASHADLVTYPNTRLGSFHSRIKGHSFSVVPHVGWARRQRGGNGDRNAGKLVLVHAGKLGASELTKRSALPLLEAAAAFLKREQGARTGVRIVFVGPKDEATEKRAESLGLKEVVSFAGRVNYEESLEWIASASVCLLVEDCDSEGIYLPSKLADYVEARKPVLALSPLEGTANDLSGWGGIRRVDGNDPETIALEIGRFYGAHKEGRLDELAPSERLVAHFNPSEVAMRFINLAREVLERRGTK